MPNTIEANDNSLDDMKAQLQNKLAGLPQGTVNLTHSDCTVKVEKRANGVSISTLYTDPKLINPGNGGSIIEIDSNGTITSYRIMPRDLGKSKGSFEIGEGVYEYALGLLGGKSQ